MPLPFIAAHFIGKKLGLGSAEDMLFGKQLRPGDVETDPNNMLGQRYNELRDPGYGISFFERMSQGGAPVSSYMSGGTSGLQAREMQQANQRSRQTNAFNAFSQYRLGRENQANSLLQMMLQGTMFEKDLMAQSRFGRDANRSSFINSLLSGAGRVAGAAAGGGYGG